MMSQLLRSKIDLVRPGAKLLSTDQFHLVVGNDVSSDELKYGSHCFKKWLQASVVTATTNHLKFFPFERIV
jgi:hypothetical protein